MQKLARSGTRSLATLYSLTRESYLGLASSPDTEWRTAGSSSGIAVHMHKGEEGEAEPKVRVCDVAKIVPTVSLLAGGFRT